MKKDVIIIGSGLGALSTALRLSSNNYNVTIVEKYYKAGGRLNLLEIDGFKFDLGPSFMSMSYELEELFEYSKVKNPLKLIELEPLYKVFFRHREKPFTIWKDLDKLDSEFADIEKDLKSKVQRYVDKGGEFFNDTKDKVIKKNFVSKVKYLGDLTKVPLKHLPYLFKNMWSYVEDNFESDEVKSIFSLVAFFLGSTPFETPSIFSMLSYTEMKNDGYWKIEGGMYKLVEELLKLLEQRNVKIYYNTEIIDVVAEAGKIKHLIDKNGNIWEADIFITNQDAAAFRGLILKRKKFSEKKLDKFKWTLAPYTVYLGIEGELIELIHHNYFLGNNFEEYSNTIFKETKVPERPYYYVNVPSLSYKDYAPEGHSSLFILCPVPDLRIKNDWTDSEQLYNNIINDLSNRLKVNISEKIKVKKIWTPYEWEKAFNLYKGSGLGLAHDLFQVGAFRPANKDEYLNNLYYVGASTIPGTGLPMVIISSKLVTERILNEYPII